MSALWRGKIIKILNKALAGDTVILHRLGCLRKQVRKI